MNSIIIHATKIVDTVFFINNSPPKKIRQMRILYIRITHTLKGHENAFFSKKFYVHLYKAPDYYPSINWHEYDTEMTLQRAARMGIH